MVFVCSKTFEPDAMGTKHFGGLLLIYAPPQTNLSLEQSSMLRVLFWSNAAISRNLRGVRLVVKWSDSDTTRRTPRKLSICMALLGAFLPMSYGT